MLPQPDRQEPTPQPHSYFMLHGKGSKDGFSIFNYSSSLLLSSLPVSPPELGCGSCAATAGDRRVLCHLPARFLVKTPFFDNSQSKGMTAPAPCQLLSRSCLEANCMCGSQCEGRKRLEFRPSWKEEEEGPGMVSGPTQDGCSSRGRLRSLSPGCSCGNAWAFSSWSMKQVNDKNTPL